MWQRLVRLAGFAAALCLVVSRAEAAAQGQAVDPRLIADLVTANHIVFDQAVVDAYGHVSVRHDKRPDRYFIARNIAPGSVTAADLLEFNLDSTPVTPTTRPLYSERFIHGEIYRTRPDVKAIVHSHSTAIVTLSLVRDARLRPVMHLTGFIGEAAPLFEFRDVGGPGSNMMVRDARVGAALARSLGPNTVVVMRGHGSAAVGTTLPEAVFRAVYSEVNARYQIEAMKLGTVNYMTPQEVRDTAGNGNIERAWDFWKAQSAEKRRR